MNERFVNRNRTVKISKKKQAVSRSQKPLKDVFSGIREWQIKKKRTHDDNNDFDMSHDKV